MPRWPMTPRPRRRSVSLHSSTFNGAARAETVVHAVAHVKTVAPPMACRVPHGRAAPALGAELPAARGHLDRGIRAPREALQLFLGARVAVLEATPKGGGTMSSEQEGPLVKRFRILW